MAHTTPFHTAVNATERIKQCLDLLGIQFKQVRIFRLWQLDRAVLTDLAERGAAPESVLSSSNQQTTMCRHRE